MSRPLDGFDVDHGIATGEQRETPMRARARTTGLAALGAIFGLVLAATTAVAPASAAKPGPTAATTATYSCAYFAGRTVTGDYVAVNSVGLKAGEAIGVTVSPAREGDMIILSVGGNGIFFEEAPATSGLKFTAPADGSYNFGWSLEAAGTRPTSLTWSFTCSSGSGGGGTTPVATDSDRDGVADSADKCAGTTLPDGVRKPAAGSYYARSTGFFADGANRTAGITVADAGGCSATQIAKSLGLPKNTTQSGISLSVLQNWAATH